MNSDLRACYRKLKCKYLIFGFFLLALLWYGMNYKWNKGAHNIWVSNVQETKCGGNQRSVNENSKQQNVDVIKSYEFPGKDIARIAKYIGMEEKVESTVSRDVPVIATAASSNHFMESLLMLENVQKMLYSRYGEIKVYYYDIGLHSWQRKRVREYPRVVLRHFPFSIVPEHARRLKGYAWKPIVIQMLIREFGFVMWMDASVRFTSPDQDRLFKAAKENGVIYRPGFFSLVVHTDRDTFTYLNEDPCSFKQQNEIEANFILVYKTRFINDFFMKPLVLCALSYGCMVTKASNRMLDCTGKSTPHACHRFDQSVFSILISRLFGTERTYQLQDYSEIQLCRSLEVPIFGESLNRLIVKISSWWTSAPDICF